MFYSYIYFTKEDASIPTYVGKGKDFRMVKHQNPKRKNHFSLHLQKQLRNGIFPITVKFDAASEEEAFANEIRLIAKFGRKDLGTGSLYNKTDGGEGSNGWKMTEESRRKCSIASAKRVGWKMSDDQKARLSKAKIGTKASDETRAKMSATRKGRAKTPEHQQKITVSLKGLKYEPVMCDVCGKIGAGGNMKRYHFERCKNA